MLRWLKNIFTTHREFVGDFIKTGDELLSLVTSNQVVRAEYERFLEKATERTADLQHEAKQSADALSGYGIAISPQAFVDALR